MTYQITPSQAKELLDHLQAVSDAEKEYIKELELYTGDRNSYTFKSKDWGRLSVLFQLQNELAKIYPDYSVGYDWLDTDYETLVVKSRITVSVRFSPINKAVNKHNLRKEYMERLRNAYNMGISLYVGEKDFKQLENVKEPIRKEYLEELVEQAKSLPPIKQEDLEEYINTYLKKHNLYVGEDSRSVVGYAQHKDIVPLVESKSPVSCFTIGAIGAFIVFAMGFIISSNI